MHAVSQKCHKLWKKAIVNQEPGSEPVRGGGRGHAGSRGHVDRRQWRHGPREIRSYWASLVLWSTKWEQHLFSWFLSINAIIGMQLVDNQIPKMKILYLIFSPSQICYQRWRMKCCWLICGVQIKICRFTLRVWRTSLPAATLSGKAHSPY